MFVIGITGGIGCGKSTLAAELAARGLPVLDADQLSRESTGPKGSAIPAIRDAFGPEVIAPDGGIDRKRMADLVFSSRNRVDQLSAIVHAVVLETMGKKLKQLEKSGAKAVVLDVPIPVKNGFLDRCHCVLAVWADEAVRLKRLAERGMSESEARRRIKMQMTREEYEAVAGEVFENNGDLDELRAFVDDFVVRQLLSRGIRPVPPEVPSAELPVAEIPSAEIPAPEQPAAEPESAPPAGPGDRCPPDRSDRADGRLLND